MENIWNSWSDGASKVRPGCEMQGGVNFEQNISMMTVQRPIVTHRNQQ